MADFPGGIYSPRTKQNKAGIVYDAAKTTIGYAEDITKLDAEVVAIENFLLPQHIFAHVEDTIAVATAGTFQDIPFNDEVSDPKLGIEHDHEADPEEFTIKKAGVYVISAAFSFEDSAITPNSHVVVRVVKNGTEIPGSLFERDISGSPHANKDNELSISILVACALEDILKFQFTSNDTTVSLANDATYGDHKDTAVISIVKIA